MKAQPGADNSLAVVVGGQSHPPVRPCHLCRWAAHPRPDNADHMASRMRRNKRTSIRRDNWGTCFNLQL